MLHFFQNDQKPETWPLAGELTAAGVDYRLFSVETHLRHGTRLRLYLVGWPRLILASCGAAVKSLVLSQPKPDVAVLGSHFEMLIFGALRALTRNRRTRLALVGFILTRRKSALANRLRAFYFRRVLAMADMVICHSRLEAEHYRRQFVGPRPRIIPIPAGIHVYRDGAGRALGPDGQSTLPTSERRPYLLAAGRSGRDYRTLCEAAGGLNIDVEIICDSGNVLEGLDPPPNVRILRGYYGLRYLQEMQNASLVVVPLAETDISAGQMVMIAAMALAKPLVVTRTPTVEEYATDGVEAVLVEPGDAAALRQAIQALLADPDRAARLGRAGARAYDQRFDIRAYVRNLLAALGEDSA